jgi:WD40 repeat protein
MWQLRVGIFSFGLVVILMVSILTWTRQQTPQSAARAFIANNGKEWHVYRVWRDGSGLRQLTPDDSFIRQYRWLAWSPDGRWLAFTSDGVYLLPAHGRGFKHLGGAYIEWMSWSPDGKSLAVQSLNRTNWGIFRLDLEGSQQPQPLSIGNANSVMPIWSPDGRWIIFLLVESGKSDIYRMRSDGTELQNLTNSPDLEMSFGWSKDGEWIHYETAYRQFMRMRGDGSGREPITPDAFEMRTPYTPAPIMDLFWHPWLMLLVGGMGILAGVRFRRKSLFMGVPV